MGLRKFFLTLALFLSLANGSESLYFMPQDGKEALEELTFRIQKAENSIDIAMFSFTNQTISKALKSAAKKGVKIRMVLDKEANTKDRYSQAGELAKIKNITCYLLSGKPYERSKDEGKMHTKLAIIDNKLTIFGSANWSKSAFENNYELIYFVEDYKIAKKSSQFFEKIVKEGREF